MDLHKNYSTFSTFTSVLIGSISTLSSILAGGAGTLINIHLAQVS